MALAAQQQAPFEVVRRARIISLLSEGVAPVMVARMLGCSERNVHKWRARWEDRPSIESLLDGERTGRPARISMETRLRIVQLACDRPADNSAPFREIWTQQALADALEQSTGERVSRSSVQRILNARGLRPHRVKT